MNTDFNQMPSAEAVLVKLNIFINDFQPEEQEHFKQKVSRIAEKARTHLSELYNSCPDKLSFIAAVVRSDVEQLHVDFRTYKVFRDIELTRLDDLTDRIGERTIKFSNQTSLEACLRANFTGYEDREDIINLAAWSYAESEIYEKELSVGVNTMLMDATLMGVQVLPAISPHSLEKALSNCAARPIERKPFVNDGTRPKRPSFSKAIDAFAKVQQIEQLKEVAGGKLKQNFDSGSFINACASRISFVLQQSGFKIPAIPGQTVSGQNGEQYIFRLTTLEKFMRKTFGPPDCEWRKDTVIGNSNNEMCTNLAGKKGILIHRWESGPHTTCTGHAEIINAEKWAEYSMRYLPPSDGVFWELPDDEQH